MPQAQAALLETCLRPILGCVYVASRVSSIAETMRRLW